MVTFGKPRLFAVRSYPHLVSHQIRSERWQGPDLTIAVLADLHVAAPWTTLSDVRRIAHLVNGLEADLILLAGDFLAGPSLGPIRASASQIVEALNPLAARLGVFAVMGNHDWKDCRVARDSDYAESSVVHRMADSHISLLRNESNQITIDRHAFWLVGLDSQRPFRKPTAFGFHDLKAAYRDVPDNASSILLAHEPDCFVTGNGNALLQISGHTHGGQLNLFGWRPLTPSDYGGTYAHGHFQDRDRHLVVSGGIGFSGVPLRVAAPPEITLITLSGN